MFRIWNMWKRKKKATVVLITVVLIMVIFLASLFNKNGYKEYSSSESFGTLVELLLKASSGEETINIDEEKINSLGTSYFKQGVKKGDITFNGLNVHMAEDNISIVIPVKYKFFPLVLSTKGKLMAKDENMIFSPQYFKVGRISVPKNKVFGFIKKTFGNKIEIKDNNLVFNKKNISNKIEILGVEKGNLIAKVNESTKKVLGKADKAMKEMGEKDKGQSNTSTSKSSSDVEKTVNNTTNKSSSSKGLTSKESQMIAIMNSTINTLDSNPSYNYWPNVNQVMGIYETLSPEEKASFKSKASSYVDVARAKRVKSKIK